MATFTPNSYTTAKSAQDQATDQVTQISNRVDNAVSVLIALEAELGQLSQPAPNGWTGLNQYVNAQVAANPGDTDWSNLQSEVGKLIADFQALETQVTAINAKIAEV